MTFYDSDPGRTSSSLRRATTGAGAFGSTSLSFLAPGQRSGSTTPGLMMERTGGRQSAADTATSSSHSSSAAAAVSVRTTELSRAQQASHVTPTRQSLLESTLGNTTGQYSSASSRGLHTQGAGTGKSVLPTLRMMEERQQAAALAAQQRSVAVHGASALTPGRSLVERSSNNLSGLSSVERSRATIGDASHSSSFLGSNAAAAAAAVGRSGTTSHHQNNNSKSLTTNLTREEEITNSLAAAAMSPKQLLERRERAAIERRSNCIDLLSTSTLPDEVKKFMASKLDEAWALELVEMRSELPAAAWVEWCATSMTEGPNYVFAVRAKQKSLSLF